MKEILVETSARHIHVTEEQFKALCGEDAVLEVRANLSQPGQFVSTSRLDIVGPKKTIPNVSILGPFRKAGQVEVSLTDARTLGVVAPVRDLARYRRLDSERLRVQRAHQVVGQARHRVVSRSRGEGDLVLRDHRTLHRAVHRGVDAEDLQRLYEALAHLADVAVVRRRPRQRIQQADRRQHVGALVRRLRLAVLHMSPRGCVLLLDQRLLLRLLLGEALLLLDPDLLFPREALLLFALALSGLLRPERRHIPLLLRVVGRRRAALGLYGRFAGAASAACEHPAQHGLEDLREVSYADDADHRRAKDYRHQHDRPEVADQRREEPRHKKVAHDAAGVGDVERGEKGVHAGRVALDGLHEARGARDEREQPHLAHSGVEPPPRDAAQPRRDAKRRHYPDREADRRVADICETVAQRADPVAARPRRSLKRLDRMPVVCQKRDQRKERYGKEKPAQGVALGFSVICIGRAACHCLDDSSSRRLS